MVDPHEARRRAWRHLVSAVKLPIVRLGVNRISMVEGHELSVLRGGIKTIRRCLPMMLIEIEERHKQNAIRDVQEFLAEIDYEGYFLLNSSLTTMNRFNLKRHQNVANIGGWKTNWTRYEVYVNNFFFIPAGGRSRLEAAVRDVKDLLS